MKERGWGRIVNVSSSSIREPIPYLTLSNANRLAALGLLETLADEVAADGITVNTVATGMFATDRLADRQGSLKGAEEAAKQRVPAKRLGQPGGVRRPGRVPVLGTGRLSHGSGDPARRRPAPVGLAQSHAVAGRGARRKAISSQTPPAIIIATLISWAWVRPRATSSLRRMNSTRKRSVPASSR